MEQPKQEICTIRIMFPVKTDVKALEIKTKITELMADIPSAEVQFAFMSTARR